MTIQNFNNLCSENSNATIQNSNNLNSENSNATTQILKVQMRQFQSKNSDQNFNYNVLNYDYSNFRQFKFRQFNVDNLHLTIPITTF